MKNQLILEFFKRPIAYHPIVAKAFGSVNLGILWSQLYYWHDKGHDSEGWIYKTSTEIYNETGLTKREQMTAREIGREAGILEEKITGKPPTVHFRLNIDEAIRLIDVYLQKQHTGQLPLIKEKIVKTECSLNYLKTISDKDVKELAGYYEVTEKFVKIRVENVINYCESSGRMYKDYKAALRKFISSDLQKDPSQKIKKQHVSELKKTDIEVKPRTPEEQERINKKIDEVRNNLAKKFTTK